MKKKISFVLIAFVIIMIPIYFLVKRTIAIEYQAESIDLFYAISDKVNPNKEKELEKIDIAIRLAPKNYLFYTTKAEMLVKLKEYQNAILEFRKIEKFEENYAEGYVRQGTLFDLLKIPDSALIQYNKALDSYNFRIEKYEDDPDKLMMAEINRLFVYIFLQDTTNAHIAFNSLKVEYPDNPTLKFLNDFDKERILNEIFKN